MSHHPSAPDLQGPEERDLGERAREAASRLEGPEPAPGDIAAEDSQARAALGVLAEAGLLRTIVALEGTGSLEGSFSVRSICSIREELAYRSGLADVMYVMQGLGSHAISLAASDELKARYLPRVASGEVIAAFALTEPDAGSDVSGIATQARPERDHYVLDGTKTYISNAGLAGLYTVFARIGSSSGKEGITAFAVEAATPGLIVKRRISVSAPHPIGTIELSECRVPAVNRLGAEGEGYSLAMRVLERFRPTVGAAANGFARRALDESLSRCRQRRQFGRPIGDLQAIRFKLADMAVRLESARLLVLRAASLLDSGSAGPVEVRRASAMAKLFATEAAQRTVDEAVQIHGGLGVTRGHVAERLYREVRALRIYEGTSEIQRTIIARTLLKDEP